MNQRGFVMTSMLWGYVAAGAVILTLTGTVYVQTLRLSACKAEHAKFVGGVEAIGKAAKKAAEDKAMQDKLSKEAADESAKRQVTMLQRTISRLRDERARSGSVPAAPATTSRPDLACFDRAELARAVGVLEAGVEGLVAEGAEAAVGLNAAREWAKGR